MRAVHAMQIELSRVMKALLAFGGAALLVVGSGCATTSSGTPLKMSELPAQPPADADRAGAVGDINTTFKGSGRGASYGPWRVNGTNVELKYVGQNRWAGWLAGRDVELVITPGKIEGAGVNLYLTQEGQTVSIRGTFSQRQISVTMTPDSLRGKMASNAPGFDLKRTAPDQWSGSWGPGGSIFMKVKGEAVQYPAVTSPQFYLALLGVML